VNRPHDDNPEATLHELKLAADNHPPRVPRLAKICERWGGLQIVTHRGLIVRNGLEIVYRVMQLAVSRANHAAVGSSLREVKRSSQFHGRLRFEFSAFCLRHCGHPFESSDPGIPSEDVFCDSSEILPTNDVAAVEQAFQRVDCGFVVEDVLARKGVLNLGLPVELGFDSQCF
jgi:hypothetical protein